MLRTVGAADETEEEEEPEAIDFPTSSPVIQGLSDTNEGFHLRNSPFYHRKIQQRLFLDPML